MKRALIIGPGGLHGAYSGGVVATLGRKLECDRFDSIYGCSAGAYTGSYLASGQPDMIEAIWRECVHDNLLIRPKNIFHGQPILDLAHLNAVLQSKPYQLSVEQMLCSPVKMNIVATECRSGMPRYFSPKSPEEFFLCVRASAAIPFLHPSVLIGGHRYIDGGLSDPLPIEKALADGHDEVVVIYNKPLALNYFNFLLSTVCALGYPGRRKMLLCVTRLRRIQRAIQDNRDRVRIVLPSATSPLRWRFDRSKIRINQLVDLGIHDALTFLNK